MSRPRLDHQATPHRTDVQRSSSLPIRFCFGDQAVIFCPGTMTRRRGCPKQGSIAYAFNRHSDSVASENEDEACALTCGRDSERLKIGIARKSSDGDGRQDGGQFAAACFTDWPTEWV